MRAMTRRFRRGWARALLVGCLAIPTALGLLALGGVLGGSGGAPADRSGAVAAPAAPTDALAATIARAQQRLREVPGDWRTWAELGSVYLEWARVSADPTYYPKAEGATQRSLSLRPADNPDALVVLGALANARHDFAAARADALEALAGNGYDANAYGVLADAETQLGDTAAATGAVQRMLDLRPGLAAYARASYDLEQHGRVVEATELMRRAAQAALDPRDLAFCRAQLGDLAFAGGDLAGADREYTAALAAAPSTVAALRGRARVAAAAGHLDEALTSYADLTRRTPTPGYLLEYAELLRVAGRVADADEQLRLAQAAHRLFSDNGGTDGLTAAALALALGQPEAAVLAAQGEWVRRQHADVADTLGWALHLAGRDVEALPYARRTAATGARSAGYAYHLGVIELALGSGAAGRADLARALEISQYFSPVEAPAARRLLTGAGA